MENVHPKVAIGRKQKSKTNFIMAFLLITFYAFTSLQPFKNGFEISLKFCVSLYPYLILEKIVLFLKELFANFAWLIANYNGTVL